MKRLLPDVECELGEFSVQTFLNASELVVSPGVSVKTEQIVAASNAGIPITGDIDIFSKAASAPIVGVTGSNGKSTVVAMLAAILRTGRAMWLKPTSGPGSPSGSRGCATGTRKLTSRALTGCLVAPS